MFTTGRALWRCESAGPVNMNNINLRPLGCTQKNIRMCSHTAQLNSPCTSKALSLGVERQILGVKISANVIPMWHAHSKRLDAAVRKHGVLV